MKDAAPWRTLAAILERWGAALCAMPLPWFVVLIGVAAVLENGIWVRPGVGFIQQMSQDPFHNVLHSLPEKHYLYTSYLGLLIAHFTGAYRHVASFALLHLAELTLGAIAGLMWIRAKHGNLAARIAGVLFLCSPISNVLLTWLGIGDTLVFAFSTLLVLASGTAAPCALAFLLGLSHLEQAAVMVGVLVVGGAGFDLETLGPDRPARLRRCVAMVAGLAGAFAVLKGIFFLQDFDLREDRISYFIRRGPAEFLGRFLQHPAATGYSLYLAAWIPLVVMGRTLWRNRRRAFGWMVFANLACLAIGLSVFDVTRVFAIMAWPFLLVLLLECRRFAPTLPPGWIRIGLAACLIGSLLLPKVIVWDGRIHSTTRRHVWLLMTGQIDPKDPNLSFLPFR